MALSYVQYEGNGSQETYAVPFPYINKSHIEVRVALDVTAYTWDDPNTVRISPAPAAGAVIEIRRITPRDVRMVDFVDASVLTESDLDLNSMQTFYIVQEAIDIAGGTLELLPDGSYGAGGRRIKELGTPIEARDAITKEYHDGTFLPQMVSLLNQTTAAKDITNTLKGDVTTLKAQTQAALDAAVAARDLAQQYRDTTKGYRDEVATWNANVNAKSANVDAKNANVDAKSANVDAKAIAAADSAVLAENHAAWSWTQAQEAAASAAAAATFDPAGYVTKLNPQIIGGVTFENRVNTAGVPGHIQLYDGYGLGVSNSSFDIVSGVDINFYHGASKAWTFLAADQSLRHSSGTILAPNGNLYSTHNAKWLSNWMAEKAGTAGEGAGNYYVQGNAWSNNKVLIGYNGSSGLNVQVDATYMGIMMTNANLVSYVSARLAGHTSFVFSDGNSSTATYGHPWLAYGITKGSTNIRLYVCYPQYYLNGAYYNFN